MWRTKIGMSEGEEDIESRVKGCLHQMEPVLTSIEVALGGRYKETRDEAIEEIEAQLKELGEEVHLKYPYKTDVLETGIDYVTTGWLIIYGIEVLKGERMAILSFESHDLMNIDVCPRSYITTNAIIVPELTSFRLDSSSTMEYRLVGEGNNNPKIEKYVEKTYIRTQKMIDDDKGKVHVSEEAERTIK